MRSNGHVRSQVKLFGDGRTVGREPQAGRERSRCGKFIRERGGGLPRGERQYVECPSQVLHRRLPSGAVLCGMERHMERPSGDRKSLHLGACHLVWDGGRRQCLPQDFLTSGNALE